MKVDLGPYRLPPDALEVFHPADWWRGKEPAANVVHHRNGLTFEIATDFTARLCGVGGQLPDAAACEALAHEAIAFYQAELLQQTPDPYPDIPL